MAHKIHIRVQNQREFDRYTVDYPVGKGPQSQNRKTDVMLVQALFQIFYYELRGDAGPGYPRYEPPQDSEGHIRVDGIKGPITQRHIDLFLDQLIRYDHSQAHNDGTLDPDTDRIYKVGQRIYTPAIMTLSDFCFLGDRMRSTPLEKRDDTLCPAPLRAELSRPPQLRVRK